MRVAGHPVLGIEAGVAEASKALAADQREPRRAALARERAVRQAVTGEVGGRLAIASRLLRLLLALGRGLGVARDADVLAVAAEAVEVQHERVVLTTEQLEVEDPAAGKAARG